MKLSRRRFLSSAALATAAVKTRLAFGASAAAAGPGGFSILQGMTDENHAQFSVVLPKAQKIRVELTSGLSLVEEEWCERPTSEFGVYKFHVQGIAPGTDYEMKLIRETGEVADQRVFRALNLNRRQVKLAYVSCAMDHLHKADVWDQFAQQAPDLCFFIGDNVYADRKTLFEKVKDVDPILLWDRYVQTRNKVSFYFQRRLTPVLATWDDHDFGGNNVNKSYPFAVESKTIFETFFAQSAAPALAVGPGITRHLQAFGADFFLLDGRTFRDEPGAGGRIFGEEQSEWLFTRLSARPTQLLSGSLFFGAYATGLDSFEGEYAEDFKEFRRRIAGSGAIVSFVSGDVHYSEIMKIEPEQLGYPSFELVSSSIHSLTFPGIHDRYTNPRRVQADSTPNFLCWQAEFQAQGMQGEVVCWTGLGDQFRSEVSAGAGSRNTKRV